MVVNPHHFEFHYKFHCPYCRRTEIYLLNPLVREGVITVTKKNISVISRADPSISENRIVQLTIGDEDIGAPLIIDRKCGYYFIPFQPRGEKPSVEKSVYNMAINFLDHLTRTVYVLDRGVKRLLKPSDLIRIPEIDELLGWGEVSG